MKVGFVRCDKIGDLVSTLPVDKLTDWEVTWLIPQSMTFLTEYSAPKRKFVGVDFSSQFKNFWNLVKILKSENFDALLLFYGPWWVLLAAWIAGVPIRGARRSQWHSYVFANWGIRQSRSRSEKHEFEYNLELASGFLKVLGAPLRSDQNLFLQLSPPNNRQLWEKWQIQPKRYTVIHPGMAGSALNWPEANYSVLIEKLINWGPVVITGTKSDAPYFQSLKSQWQHHPEVRWTIDQLKWGDLLQILNSAEAVIGPSTGVLHLSASLNTQTIGIYSPLRAHHKMRWGLRGFQSQIVSPEVNCPGNRLCLKEKCVEFNCMEKIKVNEVLKLFELPRHH